MDWMLLILVLGTAVFFWFIYQNSETYNDRSAVLTASRALLGISNEEAMAILRDFECVPYEEHFWARLTLKSPWPMYSQRIQRIVAK